MHDEAADRRGVDLTIWCGTYDTPNITTPWSDQHYSYATNGFVLVRVERRADVPERDDAPDIRGVVGDYPIDSVGLRFCPMPEFERAPERPCTSCGGHGSVWNCPTCAGDGATTCPTCRHSHECTRCGGGGFLRHADGVIDAGKSRRCTDCYGDGLDMSGPARAAVPGVLLPSRALVSLRWLHRVSTLPGIAIDLAYRQRDELMAPIRFRFDGGVGWLMPKRTDGVSLPSNTIKATTARPFPVEAAS